MHFLWVLIGLLDCQWTSWLASVITYKLNVFIILTHKIPVRSIVNRVPVPWYIGSPVCPPLMMFACQHKISIKTIWMSKMKINNHIMFFNWIQIRLKWLIWLKFPWFDPGLAIGWSILTHFSSQINPKRSPERTHSWNQSNKHKAVDPNKTQAHGYLVPYNCSFQPIKGLFETTTILHQIYEQHYKQKRWNIWIGMWKKNPWEPRF